MSIALLTTITRKRGVTLLFPNNTLVSNPHSVLASSKNKGAERHR